MSPLPTGIENQSLTKRGTLPANLDKQSKGRVQFLLADKIISLVGLHSRRIQFLLHGMHKLFQLAEVDIIPAGRGIAVVAA